MSLDRTVARAHARRRAAIEPVIRLDLLENPYGPCPAAIEAVGMSPESPPELLAARLRRQLSQNYRVPSESIHIVASINRAIRGIVSRHVGPLITFPPAATTALIADCSRESEIVSIARGVCGDAVIGPDFASDIPANGLAVIDSPSNPLGAIVSPADIVRLSRACTCVVVDERFAEFSEFSLLPIALELDNVIVLRSFASWSGLSEATCAWAVAPPRLAEKFGLEFTMVKPEAVAGAIATLEHRASVTATVKLVREDRSRLYRFLRRLSFIEPLPSWGPFITARVTIVPRQILIDGLAMRGVLVHAPPEPGLEEYVRIGIGSRTAMDRLRAALLQLGPELVS